MCSSYLPASWALEITLFICVCVFSLPFLIFSCQNVVTAELLHRQLQEYGIRQHHFPYPLTRITHPTHSLTQHTHSPNTLTHQLSISTHQNHSPNTLTHPTYSLTQHTHSPTTLTHPPHSLTHYTHSPTTLTISN